MSFVVEKCAESDLPFLPGGGSPKATIPIFSQPDPEDIEEGETEPYEWMDLRYVKDNLGRLIDADEVVLQVADATLVLTYPLEKVAIRRLSAENGTGFTRGELMQRIDETYRRVYEIEEASQSSPTPDVENRGAFINRPASDGEFGIWGHDYTDLGVSGIEVHEAAGEIWLDPVMES